MRSFRSKKLNLRLFGDQKGIGHHLILPILAILAVGSIGAYLTFNSKAASSAIPCDNRTRQNWSGLVSNKAKCYTVTQSTSAPICNDGYYPVYKGSYWDCVPQYRPVCPSGYYYSYHYVGDGRVGELTCIAPGTGGGTGGGGAGGGGGTGGGNGGSVSKTCNPHTTVKSGSRGGCVAHAQDLLNKAGFGKLVVDGVYGSATKSAINNLEKKYGLTQNGELTATDWDRLHKAASGGGSTPAPAPVYHNIHDKAYGCSVPRPTLKVNDKHKCASYLQYSLNHANVDSPGLSRTGLYNPTTQTYVKKFQQKYGLTVDGVVGSATWAKIDALATNREKKDGEKYENIHAAAYKCSQPYPTLKIYATHDCVSYLQFSLNYAGIGANLSRTDYYNGTTEGYLKKFQEKNGLTVTGVVDAKTWEKIDALSKNNEQL